MRRSAAVGVAMGKRRRVGKWVAAGAASSMLVFLLRTAVTNESVSEQLQTTFDRMIVGPLTTLGYSDPDRRAALIGSQLMGLALCRYVLRLQPLASLSDDEVVASIAPTIQRYLTAPPARQRPHSAAG